MEKKRGSERERELNPHLKQRIFFALSWSFIFIFPEFTFSPLKFRKAVPLV